MRIGIDIGGTKTDAVALGPDGAVAHRVRLPTGFGDDAVLATAEQAVERLADSSGLAAAGFESIGVGIPGAVDPVTGRVSHAVNLGLEGLELGATLAARLGRSVRVENDVNAAALGAYAALAPRPGSMAYLNLGTGLAAGLVLDGRLWRGARGVAGEIGHVPVDPSGVVCACGQRGCLETVASGSAIARQWPTDDGSPARALFAAAADGDPDAIAVRDRFADSVASAVRILVLAVDAHTVVIGGGLSSLGTPLLDGVRAGLARQERESPFLSMMGLPERVRLVAEDAPVAAVGAALIGAADEGGA